MSEKRVKLHICVGPRCDAEGRGSALLAQARVAVAAAFPEELASGRLALDTRDCLRLCTRDPIARLEPSGDAFSNPQPAELLSAIAQALRG